ncbi:MAG: 3-deoxy-7-phosphoheptulonate synthase [Methylacidiphilales bacterium]|nr:3-deoxy-7-phosphoheptulonate synthase [Candidatus Methylacidiphilales bacterium]
MIQTSDLRIKSINADLVTPKELIKTYPLTQSLCDFVSSARETTVQIISRKDPRFVVIVGPCSIHDTELALAYAKKIKQISSEYKDTLHIIMRVYFEKPRTTVGWKGLINDPDLNQSYNIDKGLRMARSLLVEINKEEVPCGTEYLDLITPQYFNDLITWGAIGARTTESQCHRQLASGLSTPVGFKNGTDGNIQIAVDAMVSSGESHTFLSVTDEGKLASFSTTGNKSTHIILRGGKQPNFDEQSIHQACQLLSKHNLYPNVMVDCSHANSNKNYKNQSIVLESICAHIEQGGNSIFGAMIESNINEGNQKLTDSKNLTYGVSITDACISWESTLELLSKLDKAVRKRNS